MGTFLNWKGITIESFNHIWILQLFWSYSAFMNEGEEFKFRPPLQEKEFSKFVSLLMMEKNKLAISEKTRINRLLFSDFKRLQNKFLGKLFIFINNIFSDF